MTAKELAELVRKTRAAQVRYFKERDNLGECKSLERTLDEAVASVLSPTPDLFGGAFVRPEDAK